MALVKYNNNSISAVTAAASIPSGSLVHIKTLTASGSATLSFVHGTDGVVLDSTYPIYKIQFINVHANANTPNMEFNLSTNGGSNYNVTKTSSAFTAWHKEDDSGTSFAYNTGNDLAQSTANQRLTFGGLDVANADGNASGELTLYNPSSTTFVKHFMARTSMNSYHPYAWDMNIAGYANTTSAINAIQFTIGGQNFDNGIFKLYGIKDS